MARITIAHGLPFVSVIVRAGGRNLTLDHVLLDTGSAATAFKTEELEKFGVKPEAGDLVEFMRGIGGEEPVVEKEIEAVEIDDLIAAPFTIQIGAMDYGFPINGILGFDFLMQTGAQINFRALEIGKP